MGCFAIAAAASSSLRQLWWARVFQGIGIGAELPVAAAMINEFIPHDIRGRMILAYQSAVGWGSVAAPALALILIHTVSAGTAWRVMFACGGLSLLVFSVFRKLLPESPRWQLKRGQILDAEKTVSKFERSAERQGKALSDPIVAVQPASMEKRTNLLELFSREYRLRTATNWIMWISAQSYTYGLYILLTHLYVTVGGLPLSRALYLTLVSSVVVTLTFYVLRQPFDRIGRKPLCAGGLIWTGSVLLLGALAWGTFHQRSWPTLAIFGILAILGVVPAAGGGNVYTPEQFPTRMRAWATGTSATWVRVTAAIMPVLVATIATSRLGVTGVWWISAIPLLFGGLWVARFGIETKGQILEEIAR
jgi:putative MFS transporter